MHELLPTNFSMMSLLLGSQNAHKLHVTECILARFLFLYVKYIQNVYFEANIFRHQYFYTMNFESIFVNYLLDINGKVGFKLIVSP